jgi:hypothetical protein
MTSPLERRLIDYALGLTWDEIPAEAIRQARRRIMDTVGGAIGAYASAPARIARRMAQPVDGGPAARVWGSLVATTPEAAAFANGTMLRFLDINDTYRTRDGSHPSDNLGGIVAACEMLGLSGRDLPVRRRGRLQRCRLGPACAGGDGLRAGLRPADGARRGADARCAGAGGDPEPVDLPDAGRRVVDVERLRGREWRTQRPVRGAAGRRGADRPL